MFKNNFSLNMIIHYHMILKHLSLPPRLFIILSSSKEFKSGSAHHLLVPRQVCSNLPLTFVRPYVGLRSRSKLQFWISTTITTVIFTQRFKSPKVQAEHKSRYVVFNKALISFNSWYRLAYFWCLSLQKQAVWRTDGNISCLSIFS